VMFPVLRHSSVNCHRMWQRAKHGRRVGLARLTRRCRARIGISEQPGRRRILRSHAFGSPVSAEHKGEAYTPNAATGSGGRSAAKPWMVKRRGVNRPTRRRRTC
jgi:hypothetical protein